MFRRVLFLMVLLRCSHDSFAQVCPTGSIIASFKLTVLPVKGEPPLLLNTVNIVGSGEKLRYEPVTLPDDLKKTARVSVIIVPTHEGAAQHFKVLPAQPVKGPAEWLIPETAAAVGLIFGPYGIDVKKAASLVEKHPEIVTKLADYAEQSNRVEALVQTLSRYEKSPPSGKSLESVLQGFSSQFGVQLPALDNKAASGQEVLKLLNALAPGVTANDPLPTSGDAALKAGGLAESIAANYFGAPLGLAIGGAALVQTLHSSLFPPTNFRSAFAQTADSGAINLCTAKAGDAKTHDHIDYVWMSRVPNLEIPRISLVGDAHLPLGTTSTIAVSAGTVGQLESLSRARDWQLTSSAITASIPVKITKGSESDVISLDLSKVKLSSGQYQLGAKWDWTPFYVTGLINVSALGNMAEANLTSASRDALIAGKGPVQIELSGADFEFVDSALLIENGSKDGITLPFALPEGSRHGYQRTMRVEINTARLSPGSYFLAVRQLGGQTGNIQVTIHPPNPEITQIPLHLNIGEPEQKVVLHGNHLQRIENIANASSEWTLAGVPDGSVDLSERLVTIKLTSVVKKGDQLDARIAVRGLEKPLKLDGIAVVVGPRPRIRSAMKSFSGGSEVELHDGEVPAGTTVSFAVQVQNVDSHPEVELACIAESDTHRKIRLAPGEKTGLAQLDFIGPTSLFVSVDPGLIGRSGCRLTAQIAEPETGTSEPFLLGRVIRLPHIQNFVLTDEKLDDSTYAATLTGQDLQLIERAGWVPAGGQEVLGVPTAVPGNPQEQTLTIALPWPPPAPKAPLYIWLRGESQPRRTNARY